MESSAPFMVYCDPYAWIAQVIQAGGLVEDALHQPLPAPFDAWLTGGMNRFEANVRSAYKRLSGQ